MELRQRVLLYIREAWSAVQKRGPRKGKWPLWGEEKSRYRWNFPLAENGAVYLALRRHRADDRGVLHEETLIPLGGVGDGAVGAAGGDIVYRKLVSLQLNQCAA